jgi:hypothetical protein
MSSPRRESVVSGRPYLIVEVSGRHPAELDDFVGDVGFVAVMDIQTFRVEGTGARDDAGVRFSQKDAATGKDVRTWQITSTAPGEFEAQAISAW